MITVAYKVTFVRQFDALEEGLQNEVLEKIELFKNPKNHKQLKVHKLHGPLQDATVSRSITNSGLCSAIVQKTKLSCLPLATMMCIGRTRITMRKQKEKKDWIPTFVGMTEEFVRVKSASVCV